MTYNHILDHLNVYLFELQMKLIILENDIMDILEVTTIQHLYSINNDNDIKDITLNHQLKQVFYLIIQTNYLKTEIRTTIL